MLVPLPQLAPVFRSRPSSRRGLRLALALVTLLTVLAGGCAKSLEDQLLDRSARRVQDAIDLMVEAKGDERELLKLSMRYRAGHHQEIVQLRKDFDTLAQGLDDAGKRALEQRVEERIKPLLAKARGESLRFPRPAKALVFLRPILTVVTPRPRPDGKLPWLPEVPPLPPELTEPVYPPGTPTPAAAPGHDHGHDHDSPGHEGH